MAIVHHNDLVQGTAEWHAARNGLLTASEMKLILTPTLKIASNEKERAHLYTLMAQRIAGYTEDSYLGDDMLRGHEDEIDSKIEYQKHYAPLEECGFITNDRWGFKLGFSPDGLVNADPIDGDGFVETKSRKHKLHLETIMTHAVPQTMPDEFCLQVQTGMLVSERNWCDFISYSAGLPMFTVRIYPNERIQAAIIDAASAFEERVTQGIIDFAEISKADIRLIPTKRRENMEIRL
jgi:hypothetical protein